MDSTYTTNKTGLFELSDAHVLTGTILSSAAIAIGFLGNLLALLVVRKARRREITDILLSCLLLTCLLITLLHSVDLHVYVSRGWSFKPGVCSFIILVKPILQKAAIVSITAMIYYR